LQHKFQQERYQVVTLDLIESDTYSIACMSIPSASHNCKLMHAFSEVECVKFNPREVKSLQLFCCWVFT